jgi:hypothetical protein
MADIKFIVECDTSKGVASIKELDKNIGQLGTTGQQSALGIGGLWKQVVGGLGATWALSKAVQSLKNFVGDSIKAAEAQEDAENALKTALELTGREVEGNARRFIDYATSIQAATKYGDEQVIQAEATLFQLTKLDREGIQRTIRGIAGMATTFKASGMTFESATNLVAKSLAGETNALARYGLKLSDNLSLEERHAKILEWMEPMWGRATAEVKTHSGGLARLKIVWGELLEKIGEGITKNELAQSAIKGATKTIEDQIPKVEKAVSGWNLYWSAVKEGVDAISKLKEKEIIPAFGTEEWAKHLKATESLTRQDWALIDATVVLQEALKTLKKVQDGWGETTKKNTEEMAKAISAAYEFQKTPIPKMEVPYKIIDFWTKYKDTLGEVVEENEHLFDAWEENTGDYEGFMLRMSQATGIWTQALQDNIDKQGISQAEIDKMNETFESHKAVVMELGMAAIEGIGSLIQEIKRLVIAETLEWIAKTVPWPFSIPVGIAAALAESALFKSLTGYEKGGWVGLHGPEIVKVGERGAEYIVPSNRITNVNNYGAPLREVFREVIRETAGPMITMHNHITINAKTLDDQTIYEAGEKIFSTVEYQARRRGRRLIA